MRLGIAHHLGWAVAVTATADHQVVDRRRIELIEPGLPPAPVHHEGGPHLMHRTGAPLDDDALEALVADVRGSVTRASAAALDELAAGSSPSSGKSAAGTSVSTTPNTSRTKQFASWESARTKCCADPGPRSDHHGRRTIASHSPQPSSPREASPPDRGRSGYG